MQVNFKAATTLGNRQYKAGVQTVPDQLCGNVKFKQLVKSGAVTVLARDAAAVNMQASKDAMNAKKAQVHRAMGATLHALREKGVKPVDVTEAASPGISQKNADAKAKRDALKKG